MNFNDISVDARSAGGGILLGAIAGGVAGYILARHIHRRRGELEVQSAVDHYQHWLDKKDERITHLSRQLNAILADLETKNTWVLEDESDEPDEQIDNDPDDPDPRIISDIDLSTSSISIVERKPALSSFGFKPEDDEGSGDEDPDWADEDDADVDGPAEDIPRGESGTGRDDVPDNPDARNVFTGNRHPGMPYDISDADFGDDNDYEKITLTYYAGDDVLVDDKEVPIRNTEPVVGHDISKKFGLKSNDEHIAYIRNERLEVDFEVCLDFRSYTEVVLGYGNPKMRSTNIRRTE
jgi:hypothetical protein